MTLEGRFALLYNPSRTAVADLPQLPIGEFREAVRDAVTKGGRLAALFGHPAAGGGVRLIAAVADRSRGAILVTTSMVGDSYPALTPVCPAAHWFERELFEEQGVRPDGHPWLKPVRFLPPRPGSPAPRLPDFFTVAGDEVHEVAVGPVHAGIIEPGHFRFQCFGERVLHLEIALGYQHRGVERALVGGPRLSSTDHKGGGAASLPDARSIHYAETVAGDSSIGHAIAYSQVVEALTGARVPARAEALRGIALELERLANHTGDLGALAQDIGYLPSASFCGRLRGDFLNLTALLCGSRLGRGLVRPGGVLFDLDGERAATLGERLGKAFYHLRDAVELLWRTPSVLARFEGTGRVDGETAAALGLVGPAARASGLDLDARRDFPSGIYAFAQIPVSTWHSGDVFARAQVRWLEIQRSVEFIRDQAAGLPGGGLRGEVGAPAPDSLALALVEGWRGEICHAALTGPDGRFAAYKVVDPSAHNWTALALALREQQISDFPLCNKSFNLSYCGHDR